jgi:hypothetical protein
MLDLAEEKGGYGGCFLQEEAQEREGYRFIPTRTIRFTREITFQGFMGGGIEDSTLGFTKL